MKDLSTKSVHDALKKLALIHNLIMKGMYPGMAFEDIKDAKEYIDEQHGLYLAEFKLRPDAVDFEPNIHKVGTAEFVDVG